MPAAAASQPPQTIDWPGLRASSVVVGIRAAARAVAKNLPPIEQNRFVKRVLKRAEREQWLTKQEQAVSSVATSETERQTARVVMLQPAQSMPMSSTVVTGAQALSDSMADDRQALRTHTTRAARRRAEHESNRPDPEQINTRALADIAAVDSRLHGCERESGGLVSVAIRIELPHAPADAPPVIDV